MLMGHSVEGRFPFLDHRVAEFAARLPDRLRLRGLRREVRCCAGPRRARLPAAIASARSGPTARRSRGVFVGRDAPAYVASSSTPSAARERRACSTRRRSARRREDPSRRTPASARPTRWRSWASISTMLLHEQLVASPRSRRRAMPTRVVVGATSTRPAWPSRQRARCAERRRSGCSTTACSRRRASSGQGRGRRRRRRLTYAELLDGGAALRARRSRTTGSSAATGSRSSWRTRSRARPRSSATLLAGGVFVRRQPADEGATSSRYILDDCEASFLVTEADLARASAGRGESRRTRRGARCAGVPRRRRRRRARPPGARSTPPSRARSRRRSRRPRRADLHVRARPATRRA